MNEWMFNDTPAQNTDQLLGEKKIKKKIELEKINA